ncbi:MAG: hypothetical protein HY056_14110 [Proteobacteria bacterium]|nr:hypothetical protein [Pseudomonadota bacterium]
MADAGRAALECQRVLAKTGDNLVGEILRLADNFYEWDHYPSGDAIDPETHAQYYYHAHSAEQRGPGEHGHFHTFLRPEAMALDITPVTASRWLRDGDAHARDARAPGSANHPCHIVAIAMNESGAPIRLFTTNRWVTGDDWYRAGDVVAMLDRFVIDTVRPSWAVNRWISAMLALMRPQIVALLAARDRAIVEWQARHGEDHDVFEDRMLEVTSSIDIDARAHLHRIEAALGRWSVRRRDSTPVPPL